MRNKEKLLNEVLKGKVLIKSNCQEENEIIKKWFRENCKTIHISRFMGNWSETAIYMRITEDNKLWNTSSQPDREIEVNEFLELMNPTTPKSLLIEGRSVVKFRNGETGIYIMGGLISLESNEAMHFDNYKDNLECSVLFYGGTTPERLDMDIMEIYNKNNNGSASLEDCKKFNEGLFNLVWKREEEKKPVVINIGILGSLEGIIKNNQTIIINGVELQVRLKE